jgi:hypothetical protein
MKRRPFILVLAMVLSMTAFTAASPPTAAASCHVDGYRETSKTTTFTDTPGNTVTATARVRWRYHYDCSWNIIAVEIDWRRITVSIVGEDYLCCYQRDLISYHVISKYIAPDKAYPAYAPCARENCTFGPWTDYGNVYIPYSPAAWEPDESPHVRMFCSRCQPVGIQDMTYDYWFVHGRAALKKV